MIGLTNAVTVTDPTATAGLNAAALASGSALMTGMESSFAQLLATSDTLAMTLTSGAAAQGGETTLNAAADAGCVPTLSLPINLTALVASMGATPGDATADDGALAQGDIAKLVADLLAAADPAQAQAQAGAQSQGAPDDDDGATTSAADAATLVDPAATAQSTAAADSAAATAAMADKAGAALLAGLPTAQMAKPVHHAAARSAQQRAASGFTQGSLSAAGALMARTATPQDMAVDAAAQQAQRGPMADDGAQSFAAAQDAVASLMDGAAPASISFGSGTSTASISGAGAISAPVTMPMEARLDMAQTGEWLDQLARDIARTGDSGGKLRFQLEPPTLGRLQVDIAASADGTAIRMTTETEAARAILADAQPKLVAEARAHGVRVSDAQIMVGASSDSAATRDSASQNSGQNGASGGTGSAGGQGGQTMRDQNTRDQREAAPNPAPIAANPDDDAASADADADRFA